MYVHLARPHPYMNLHVADGAGEALCGRTYGKPVQQTEQFRHDLLVCDRCFNPELPPLRSRANRLVGAALRAGLLEKEPCSECGAEPAVAHHDDYGKPLTIRWLCHSCHTKWHRRNKARYTGLEQFIRVAS